jgi:2-polyprenyl-6-methoxyphenol hydroxylase-like FAD-dependent oxidoreductase
MKILISGGGIAGLAAALFLARHGHEVRVIDRAPSFQKRGYALSLKSFGVKLMSELGLEGELRRHALVYDKLCFYHADGRFIQSLSAEMVDKATHGQIFTYRSELHGVLHDAVLAALATPRYGVHIEALSQDARGAKVTLSDGAVEEHDLVVVAEGMRSTTRGLLWGAEGQKAIGVRYAAATVDVVHELDPHGVHGYVGEGRNAAFLPVDAGRLLMQCYWRSPGGDRPDPRAARASMVEAFQSFGPGVRRLLDTIAPDGDVFCDAVSMIVLPSLVRGRVVLLGDAGYCPTFLSGMGASLGLLGAKLLSMSLPAEGVEVEAGLRRYDDTLRPVIQHFQTTAVANADNALPSTHLKEVLLGWALHLLPPSLLARQFGKQFAIEENLLRGIV